MKSIVEKIAQCVLRENIQSVRSVSGGDINDAYAIQTTQSVYFLKLNDAHKRPNMFVKEAEGLQSIAENSSFKVPEILKFGVYEDYQYLFLEFIETGIATPTTYETMGKKLAKMHRKEQPYFGFLSENYMGDIYQKNKHFQDWQTFFAECRILPLVEKLYNENIFEKKEISKAKSLCKEVSNIFPEEPPSLIHGDLWGGNYMVDKQSQPVLIDPAVSYSHREMDIAMTRLFGGFTDDFYKAYHSEYPLDKGWQNRLEIGQLYPLLIHALLFGGAYISHCKEILKKF